MPQYAVGHLDRVAEVEQQLHAFPGVVLAGSGAHGLGIPDCIASAERAVAAIRGDQLACITRDTFNGGEATIRDLRNRALRCSSAWRRRVGDCHRDVVPSRTAPPAEAASDGWGSHRTVSKLPQVDPSDSGPMSTRPWINRCQFPRRYRQNIVVLLGRLDPEHLPMNR